MTRPKYMETLGEEAHKQAVTAGCKMACVRKGVAMEEELLKEAMPPWLATLGSKFLGAAGAAGGAKLVGAASFAANPLNWVKGMAITSVMTGIPLGILMHSTERSVEPVNRKLREATDRVNYFADMESQLASNVSRLGQGER